MAELTDIRETVRARYARAATEAACGACGEARALEAEGGCCGPGSGCGTPTADGVAFGAVLYRDDDATGAPAAAVEASLGCGVPTAVADLHEGEVVLDLGSGAGADVLISARRVARCSRSPAPRRLVSRTSSSSRATLSSCRSPTQASMS